MVVRSRSRAAVVAAACCHRRLVEGVDERARVRAERDVHRRLVRCPIFWSQKSGFGGTPKPATPCLRSLPSVAPSSAGSRAARAPACRTACSCRSSWRRRQCGRSSSVSSSYPNCTVSIETEPPSMPSTGNAIASFEAPHRARTAMADSAPASARKAVRLCRAIRSRSAVRARAPRSGRALSTRSALPSRTARQDACPTRTRASCARCLRCPRSVRLHRATDAGAGRSHSENAALVFRRCSAA